jgi:hypothetical protein
VRSACAATGSAPGAGAGGRAATVAAAGAALRRAGRADGGVRTGRLVLAMAIGLARLACAARFRRPFGRSGCVRPGIGRPSKIPALGLRAEGPASAGAPAPAPPAAAAAPPPAGRRPGRSCSPPSSLRPASARVVVLLFVRIVGAWPCCPAPAQRGTPSACWILEPRSAAMYSTRWPAAPDAAGVREPEAAAAQALEAHQRTSACRIEAMSLRGWTCGTAWSKRSCASGGSAGSRVRSIEAPHRMAKLVVAHAAAAAVD